jgi:hypothetical protein
MVSVKFIVAYKLITAQGKTESPDLVIPLIRL